jgi:hypothetical protein
VQAQQTGSVLGIHILHPSEAEKALELIQPDQAKDTWYYVTIPLTLQDMNRKDEWQSFFRLAKEKKIIPIIRLSTKYENGSWQVPTKKNIVQLFAFMDQLEWPSNERYVIVFNEVNHAKEWGGYIDPAEYADILRFTSNWAKSEGKNYQVLPAAMDLAAPNGGATREALTYLEQMHQADNSIFEYVDYWNSHSYPNPGFSSSPEKTDKNSLRGFTYELSYVKEKSGRELRTFITETGWVETPQTRRWLSTYYQYAVEHIWSDARVVAVTPFILRGDPGPFSGFSFLNRRDEPTSQYQAYRKAVESVANKN